MLVRMVEGVSGTVDLRMTLGAAFEYGSAEPRVLRHAGAHRIVAGSETLWLFGPAHVRRAAGHRDRRAHGQPGRPGAVRRWSGAAPATTRRTRPWSPR